MRGKLEACWMPSISVRHLGADWSESLMDCQVSLGNGGLGKPGPVHYFWSSEF
jgi:hypothetical protein